MRELPEGWVETEFGLLPKAWEPVEAQQFCKKVADGTHDSPKQQETGKLLITSKNIKDSRLDVASAYYISNDDFNEVNRRSKVDQWDVLLSMIGTVGEVCLIDSEPDFAIKNVGLFKCGNETKGKWLYYFLKSKSGQHYIYSRLSGTTQKYITLGELRKFPIPNPPLSEQKAIADMLSSLDDKIELLREQNKTLETLAQTIFKEWFVNFNYPDATGEMIESELGEIPKGWRVERLGEALEVKRGGSPRPIQDYLSDSGYRWLKISDATATSSPFIFEIKEHIKKEGLKKTTLLKKGSLVLSNSATPGVPKFLELDSCIHDGWLHFPSTNIFSYQYLYLFFLHIRKPLLQQGNGSVFKNLKTDILKGWMMVIPDLKTMNDFNEFIAPIFEKIKNNASQVQSLSKTRDTLLPKLMSGQVKAGEG